MNKHGLISLHNVTKVTVSPVHTFDYGIAQTFYTELIIETKDCKFEIILEAEAKENLVAIMQGDEKV